MKPQGRSPEVEPKSADGRTRHPAPDPYRWGPTEAGVAGGKPQAETRLVRATRPAAGDERSVEPQGGEHRFGSARGPSATGLAARGDDGCARARASGEQQPAGAGRRRVRPRRRGVTERVEGRGRALPGRGRAVLRRSPAGMLTR